MLQNNQSTTSTNSSLGRKAGSKNKLTAEAKKILFDVLKDDLGKIELLMRGLPLDERLIQLKHFSKFLASGNDEIAKEVRAIIYDQLTPHYKKMGTFISHVPQDKKVSELRAFLKLLTPEKVEEIVTDMKNNQKIKFSS